MKRYLFSLFLASPFLILLSWTIKLHYQKETLPEVILPITGYDPRDLLSGHYIQYQIDWNKADCSQFEDTLCPRGDFDNTPGQRNVHRFYIHEKDAFVLNEALTKGEYNGEKVYFSIIYAYRKGIIPIPKHLLINDKNWQEIIINNKGE